MNCRYQKTFILATSVWLCCCSAWAAGPATQEQIKPLASTVVQIVTDEKEEAEIVQKVRARSYPGGSDEADLKVQGLLLKPTRKISPTIEEGSDSAPAQD